MLEKTILEKTIKYCLLFDFYGKLLTEKQQTIIELYYYNDLSLVEIAEEVGISRQGVYDHLHRAEMILEDFENKLGLVAKYTELKQGIDCLVQYVEKLDIPFENKEELDMIVKGIKKQL